MPCGDEGVQVGMEVEVLAEGVNRHDDIGQSPGQGKGGAQVFELTVVAADAGEALFEIAAVRKLVDDLGDDRPQEAVPGLVTLLADLRERLETSGKASAQGDALGWRERWTCSTMPPSVEKRVCHPMAYA